MIAKFNKTQAGASLQIDNENTQEFVNPVVTTEPAGNVFAVTINKRVYLFKLTDHVFVNNVQVCGTGASPAKTATEIGTLIAGVFSAGNSSNGSVSLEELESAIETRQKKLGIFNAVDDFNLVGDNTTINNLALSTAFTALKASGGGQLFFPAGTYKFTNHTELSEASNIHLFGEPGTVLSTSINKVVTLSGNLSDIKISEIKFQSTRSDSTDDPEGLLFIANYGNTSLMRNIRVFNCAFNNPGTKANGIKVISEGAESMIDGLFINYNRFYGIGRFGVETQNHNNAPSLVRLKNVDISYNTFDDIGTIQTGVAVAAVSVSGWSTDFRINYNEITDVRMQSTSQVYYGIENAGAINCEMIGNIIRSSTFGFTGILGSGPDDATVALGQLRKTRWTIANNIIDLTGSVSDKTKIRGMDIGNVDGFSIINNTITADGIGIRCQNATNGIITGNYVKSMTDRPIYLTSASSKNALLINTLWTLKSGDNTCIMFDGSTTSNNSVFGNRMTDASGNPGDIFLANGAPANNRQSPTSLQPLRVHSSNAGDAAVFSTSGGGEIRIGQNGRTIGAYISSNGALGNLDIAAVLAYFSGAAQISGNMQAATVGIGPNAPHSKSLLDLSSTTKGSRPYPVMTAAQRLAITSPPVSLHVYQSDGGADEGVWVYKSGGWGKAY